MMGKLLAEAIGTFWLVLAVLGSAVWAAGQPDVGIGWLGVALAVGLSVLSMAAAIGHVSGCHLNPAVTISLVGSGRFPAKDAIGYVVAQVVGGLAAAGVFYLAARGVAGFEAAAAFAGASNGVGEHSAIKLPWQGGFIVEAVVTALFVFVIHGATDKRGAGVIAPIAIGLCLVLALLVSIPATNGSLNPARSTATAVMAQVCGEGWPLRELWLFWVAPIVGGIVGGLAYKTVAECCD
ncbi:MAG: aquaporin Z [Planctomycetaceae bacterium]